MKAFLLSLVVMAAISVGASFYVDGNVEMSASDVYSSPSVRLD